MKKNNFLRDLITALVINVVIFGFFYTSIQKLNVFTLLGFTALPIVLSIIFCAVINFRSDLEKNEKIIKTLIYAVGNGIYLIGQKIVLYRDPNLIHKILSSTKVGLSQYMSIGIEENKILPIVVLLVISFALHYLILNRNKNRGAYYEK